MPGPPPKKDAIRRPNGLEQLSREANTEYPPMPEGDWLPETVRWYEDLASLPQAREWGAGNWATLRQTVFLAQSYYDYPKSTTAAELRLRQASLDVTDADLRRSGKTPSLDNNIKKLTEQMNRKPVVDPRD